MAEIITQRKSGMWHANFSHKAAKNGRERRKLSKDKRRAEKMAKDLLAKYELGEVGLADIDCDFGNAQIKFLKHRRTSLRENTVDRDEDCLNNIQDYCQFRNVSEVTTPILLDYRDSRLSDGKSPRTVNLEIGTLKTFIDYCVEKKYLRKNPIREMKNLIHKNPKKKRALSLDEFFELIEVCSLALRNIVCGMSFTGMRSAEAVNLLWTDIDLKEGVIHIQAKEDWQPKTTEGEIPIGVEMGVLLEAVQKESKSRFVFPNGNNAKYQNNLWRDYKAALGRAGIDDQKLDVHSLRRTFCTRHALLGTNSATLKRLARHTDIKVTDGYIKMAQKDLKSAAQLSLYKPETDLQESA